MQRLVLGPISELPAASQLTTGGDLKKGDGVTVIVKGKTKCCRACAGRYPPDGAAGFTSASMWVQPPSQRVLPSCVTTPSRVGTPVISLVRGSYTLQATARQAGPLVPNELVPAETLWPQRSPWNADA